ncbi:Sh3-containing grb2 protein 1 (Endophilin II) [Fasciola hepatica]|uniref:Sh3-containing grb2 protein 1 (Endophilin II) n=1 Tax=Fasciola hepatica TaxID=6192 RepID=A0A4E0RJ90_FASHE|nr:Sh3-containing grb2 protein 1 (Endophilin II) [Fasciola hepatica]
MPFANFKKKLAESNQLLAEKIAKAKRTDPGEEYNRLTKLIDIHKHYYKDVCKRATACLEPTQKVVSRIRPTAAAAGSHSAPVREGYPHAELLLGDCFLKYGEQFGRDTTFDNRVIVQSGLIHSFSLSRDGGTDNKQVKYIANNATSKSYSTDHLCKKTESRRLTYDTEKKAVEKGRIQPSSPQFVEAQKKFDEAINDSTAAMVNFLDSEVEQIEILNNLISAQLSYHQEAARLMSDLHNCVQAKLQEAKAQSGNRLLNQNFNKLNVGDNDQNKMTESQKVEARLRQEGQNATPSCRALFDFEAENPFELSFHEGDLIRLIEQVDDNWYLGELHGQEGHFPTSYVEVLVPLP